MSNKNSMLIDLSVKSVLLGVGGEGLEPPTR